MAAPMYARTTETTSRGVKFKPCSVDGCERNAHTAAFGRRGWCSRHYNRWQKHGDPNGGRPTMSGDPMNFIQEVAIPFTGEQCLIWPYATDTNGRGHISIGGRTIDVNRVICEARHGKPSSPDLEVAHSCGMGHESCCNPIHLRWATTVENSADRKMHGTHRQGEQIHSAKLTEEKVRRIRALKDIKSLAELSTMFGVTKSTICLVQSGKRWGWVTE